MDRCVRAVACAVLLFLTACGGLRQAPRLDGGGGGAGGQPLTTLHAQVFKLIVRGEIPQALEYYKLAVGVEQVPRWLLLMQGAFSTANRVAGPCREVADDIYEAFKRLGQSPQIVRIWADGNTTRFLSWQGKIMMSNTNTHYAVMNAGRIYDAFTGPQGLAWAEYQALVHSYGALSYSPVP
ncbi:MAG TPA: hypothetical protein VK420_11385 [Longimicrobium sp.]|nr:hypothetical protein [Longimicrobium sp.]